LSASRLQLFGAARPVTEPGVLQLGLLGGARAVLEARAV